MDQHFVVVNGNAVRDSLLSFDDLAILFFLTFEVSAFLLQRLVKLLKYTLHHSQITSLLLFGMHYLLLECSELLELSILAYSYCLASSAFQ